MAKSNAATKQAPVKAKASKKIHTLTAKQQKAFDLLEGPSKRIRYLTGEGLSRVQIVDVCPNAKGGKILYQHVKNVQDAMIAKDKAEKAKAKA